MRVFQSRQPLLHIHRVFFCYDTNVRGDKYIVSDRDFSAVHKLAVDIEENAVAAAMENAEKNHISTECYKAYCGNVLCDDSFADKIDAKYDIITANIVADVLIAMGNLFDRYLKNNGILIISGIIEERMDEVVNAVEKCGFTALENNIKEGWAAVKLIHNKI